MSGDVVAAVVTAASCASASEALRRRDREAVRWRLAGRPSHEASRHAGRVTPRHGRAVGVALAAVSAGYALAGVAGGVGGLVAAVVAPAVGRRRRAAAELAALDDGLADAASSLAAGIRAGRSMRGALEEASVRVAAPLGPRLADVVGRVDLGVPVERAVLDLARSLPGSDARLVAAVVGLHQRSGGDAPVVLDRVARTLRERRASAREVRSLTAQARLSGAILGLLPIGFFLFLSVTSRADVERALASPTGLTSVCAGLAMQGLAFLWIRRILRIES